MKRLLRARPPFVAAYERAKVDMRTPWRETEFVALDFEATGLDLRHDEVVSFGAVLVRSGRVVVGTSEYALVRPATPVPGTSSIVHSIRNQDLAAAMDPGDAAQQLIELLTGRVLLAHAAWVEVAFLRRLLRLHHARFRTPVIDTAALSRALGLRPRIGEREPELEALAVQLGMPVHESHHALGDAMTTAQIFLMLAASVEREQSGSGPLSVGALQSLTHSYALLRS